MSRKTPSAIVDRQMLPRQQNSTETFSGIVDSVEVGVGGVDEVVGSRTGIRANAPLRGEGVARSLLVRRMPCPGVTRLMACSLSKVGR